MNNRTPKLFLISNMYPSKRHVRYGVFVKNFEKAISDNFSVKKIVLIKYESFLLKLLGYIFLYLKIFSLLFRAKPEDIVYVHFPLHTSIAIRLVGFFKKNIILNFHGSDLIFHNKKTKFLEKNLKPLIKEKEIVVPSTYYKNKIINEYDVNPDKIFVYPSGGIDTNVFYPKKIKKGKSFVLGFVSNFIKEKGWLEFLKAAENLNIDIKNLEIVMIGEGEDKVKIMDFLEKSNLTSRVISNITQKELAIMYNQFDLFVFPTYREAESLGLVGLEAMSCGVPVVAGKVGGPMGYVKDGINSFLFNKRDVKDLQNKVLKYYNMTSGDKKKMQFEAVKTAKKYDSRKVNKELLKFLKKQDING